MAEMGIFAFFTGLCVGAVCIYIALARTALREKRFFQGEAQDARDRLDALSTAYGAVFEQHQNMVLALVKMGEVATVLPLDPSAEMKFGQTQFRVNNPMGLADLILQEWEARESMLWACIKGDTGILIQNEDGTTEEYAPHREIEILKEDIEDLRSWFKCPMCLGLGGSTGENIHGEQDYVCEFCDGAGVVPEVLVEKAAKAVLGMIESYEGSPRWAFAGGLQSFFHKIECPFWELKDHE